MIKEITPQIAGLYLGGKCEITSVPSWYSRTVNQDHRVGAIVPLTTLLLGSIERSETDLTFVLCLRPLESLTESEARELYEIRQGEKWEFRPEWLDDEEPDLSCLRDWWNGLDEYFVDGSVYMLGSPQVWLKLLSWGFDLFGLIQAGLAKEVTNV